MPAGYTGDDAVHFMVLPVPTPSAVRPPCWCLRTGSSSEAFFALASPASSTIPGTAGIQQTPPVTSHRLHDLLLCNKLPPELRTYNNEHYYLAVSGGQEFRSWVAWGSHEDTMNLSAGTVVIGGLIWAGRYTSKVTGVAVGWRLWWLTWQWASPRASGPERKRLQVAKLPFMN